MNDKPPVSLAEHTKQLLRPFSRGIPIWSAVSIAVLFGITTLIFQMKSDEELLASLGPHVSTLVETQDRPELQRLLKSIEQIRNSQLLVIDNGIVLSSSRSLRELDRPVQLPQSFPITTKVRISTQGLVTSIPLHRLNGPAQISAKIMIVTPIFKVLMWSLFVALLVLNIGFFIVNEFTSRLGKAITLALAPVGNLDEAIRSLRTLKNPKLVRQTGINELENIREAILETYQSLTQAMETIAHKKAKELATEAYQRLLHDLHNQIRCLGNLLEATDAEIYGLEAADEASKKIPFIAEQILLQIESAKSNLDFEIPELVSKDIRECLQTAADEARVGSSRAQEFQLEVQVPAYPVLVAHDANLFRRAIVNILKNAIEACNSRITIGLRQEVEGASTDSRKIQIQIMDDGPGLTSYDASLYLQGRKKSTKGDRAARGLAAANHIIRSHGGKVIYRSSALGGACFEVKM